MLAALTVPNSEGVTTSADKITKALVRKKMGCGAYNGKLEEVYLIPDP
jgi:hypothetical protein